MMEVERTTRGAGEGLLSDLARVTGDAASSLVATSSALLGDRGCCFTFHRLAAPSRWADLPNRRFYLDAGFLAQVLGYLRQTGWAIVSMEEALQRSAAPDGGRFVNFSVDDCYRDTAEAVVPLFRRLGAPVTLYVQTGIPDRTHRLIKPGLETIIGECKAVTDAGVRYVLNSSRARRAAFATISRRWDQGNEEAEYLGFCRAHGFDPVALDAQHAITWEMLESMRDNPLVEIGAHTISHPHVAQLSPAEAECELVGSRRRIEQRLDIEVRHFAFPFGRRADCSPRDFALARKAGFASAATTRKGLLRPGRDPYRIPRNTLNGAHRRLWLAEAHLIGAGGVAAWMTGRV